MQSYCLVVAVGKIIFTYVSGTKWYMICIYCILVYDMYKLYIVYDVCILYIGAWYVYIYFKPGIS